MKSIKQQYIDLREGRMSQHNFMRSVRMSMPQYITNVTSFNDTVKILKNKGILNEAIDTDSSEARIKFYLAKGYSYIDAIRKTAADSGMEEEEEEMLMKKYPQVDVDTEEYETDDEDAEFEDILTKYGDSPETYKFQDTDKYLSEDDDDEEETPKDYVDPDMFDAYGMDASEGLKVVKEPNKYAGKWRIVSVDGKKTPLTNKFFNSEDDAKKYGREKIQTSHKIIQLPAETNVYKKIDEAKEIKGSSSKEQYSKFDEAENDNLQELTTGINIEHECFPEKTYEEIEKIVLKNIKKNPNYYTNYKLTGIRDYQLQTMDTSKPETHQMKFVKGEDSYVDKARVMKPVKGFEKAKASSNKASKEVNKIVKGVEELTHFAQTVRGLQKFATTGGKMKTIKLKEDYESFLSQKQGEEAAAKEIMQATNASGVKFSVNDMAVAPDGKEIKITGFTTGKDGKMKAMYSTGMFADVYNLDDLEKKPSFRPGVNLGKYDLKSMLEKMVREVLDEMADGRDDMNAKNEY